MTLTGQCRCEAVRYTIDLTNKPLVYACHCQNCQRWSGSAFGLHLMLPETAMSITGELNEYRHEHAGTPSRQFLCAQCHTRIFNTTEAAPGMRVLRAGTLDNAAELTPAAHIWTRRKHAWLNLPPDVPTWPESPSPEEFARAVVDGRVMGP